MRLNLKNRVDVGPALLPSKVRQYSGTISELWWWLLSSGRSSDSPTKPVSTYVIDGAPKWEALKHNFEHHFYLSSADALILLYQCGSCTYVGWGFAT